MTVGLCGGDSGGQVQTTADSIAQQKVNAQLWNHYVQNYKPLIEKHAGIVTDPGRQEAEARQVAGQINADLMKGVDTTRASLNPVKNASAMTGVAKTSTSAQIHGQGAIKTHQLGQIQNLIDIGRGQATQAQTAASELAGESIKTAIAKEGVAQKADAATENAWGSAAGAAAAAALRGAGTPRTLTPLDPLFP